MGRFNGSVTAVIAHYSECDKRKRDRMLNRQSRNAVNSNSNSANAVDSDLKAGPTAIATATTTATATASAASNGHATDNDSDHKPTRKYRKRDVSRHDTKSNRHDSKSCDAVSCDEPKRKREPKAKRERDWTRESKPKPLAAAAADNEFAAELKALAEAGFDHPKRVSHSFITSYYITADCTATRFRNQRIHFSHGVV